MIIASFIRLTIKADTIKEFQLLFKNSGWMLKSLSQSESLRMSECGVYLGSGQILAKFCHVIVALKKCKHTTRVVFSYLRLLRHTCPGALVINKFKSTLAQGSYAQIKHSDRVKLVTELVTPNKVLYSYAMLKVFITSAAGVSIKYSKHNP